MKHSKSSEALIFHSAQTGSSKGLYTDPKKAMAPKVPQREEWMVHIEACLKHGANEKVIITN